MVRKVLDGFLLGRSGIWKGKFLNYDRIGWFKLKKNVTNRLEDEVGRKIVDEIMIIPRHHAARTPYSVGEPPNWQELRKPVLEPLHGPSASA